MGIGFQRGQSETCLSSFLGLVVLGDRLRQRLDEGRVFMTSQVWVSPRMIFRPRPPWGDIPYFYRSRPDKVASTTGDSLTAGASYEVMTDAKIRHVSLERSVLTLLRESVQRNKRRSTHEHCQRQAELTVFAGGRLLTFNHDRSTSVQWISFPRELIERAVTEGHRTTSSSAYPFRIASRQTLICCLTKMTDRNRK